MKESDKVVLKKRVRDVSEEVSSGCSQWTVQRWTTQMSGPVGGLTWGLQFDQMLFKEMGWWREGEGSRSLCKQFSPPWFIFETGSPCVTLFGLELTDPPASVSLVLELKEYASSPASLPPPATPNFFETGSLSEPGAYHLATLSTLIPHLQLSIPKITREHQHSSVLWDTRIARGEWIGEEEWREDRRAEGPAERGEAVTTISRSFWFFLFQFGYEISPWRLQCWKSVPSWCCLGMFWKLRGQGLTRKRRSLKPWTHPTPHFLCFLSITRGTALVMCPLSTLFSLILGFPQSVVPRSIGSLSCGKKRKNFLHLCDFFFLL